MIRNTLFNVGACLLIVTAGCAQNSTAANSVLPSVMSRSSTTQSTAVASGAAVALGAGYAPSPMDQFTNTLRWVTAQSSSDVSTLQAAGAYTDVYVSSIRELSNYAGTQPAWTTVNLHEDAFKHTADPATLTLLPSNGAVALAWKADARASMGVTIQGYAIYEGSSATSLSQVATVAAGQSSYQVTGLSPGQKYFFSVQSVIGGSPTSYSWTESAVASTPTTLNLDSPSYSLSAQPSPGGTVTLSVSVHGSASNAHMELQAEVAPTTSTSPVSAVMSLGSSDVYQGSLTVTIPSGFYGGIAYRVVDTNSGVSLPAAGQSFYVTSPNNRLHFGRYANNYLMDAASPEWQTLLASYLTSIAQTGKYNGVLLDDTVGYMAQTRPDAFPYGYTDPQYLSGVKAQYSALRSAVPSSIQISANGLSNPTVAAAVAPYLNGAEIEEFAYDNGGWHYAPASYWVSSINNIFNITQQDHLRTRLTTDGSTDPGVRTYIFGSYLLVYSANTYYDLETSLGMGQVFPELAAPVGAPVQTFSTISSAWVAADRAYERHFANGWAIVNPSQTASTATIAIPAGYSELVINGGSLEQGGTTSLEPVSSITLAPDQAAILIGAPTSSAPSPIATSSSTATTSAGTFTPVSQGAAYSNSVFTYVSGNPAGLVMSSTPSGTSGGVGINVPASATITHGWLTTSGSVARTSWPSGNYTVHYTVTGPNTALTLTKVELLRVSSTGSSVLAVVGSQNVSQMLSSGTYTYTVSGAAQPSTNSNDLLGVRFTITNGTGSSQKFYFDAGPSGTASLGTPFAPTTSGSTVAPTISSSAFSPVSQGAAYSNSVFTYVSGNPAGLVMSSTPSGTSGGVGINVPASATITHGWLTTSGSVARTSWPSGNYTVHYTVTGPNTALTLTKVELLRVSSTGSSVLAVVGSQNVSQMLSSGTYTYTVSGAAQPSTNSNDLLGARFTITNGTGSSQKFYFDVGPSGTASVGTPF